MRWSKRGVVYVPDGTRTWARRNASFPTVEVRGDLLRVYYSALDDQSFGRTGYVDLDAEHPSRVVYESPDPVLDLGEVGAFDDSGATAFAALQHDGATYLYYQGWQRAERAPYLIFTGLAIDDGSGFRRHSRVPVLDRTPHEPFLRGAPHVLRTDDGFRMWFVSSWGWVEDEHGLHYQVDIRHATSSNAIDWEADPEPCIALQEGEYAVGRPSVLFEEGVYRMWYAIRSFVEPYRLGYAESDDGLHWERRDAAVGITRSASGWDSEMICYPQVVRVGTRLLMFYNGNHHGRSGFGYAEATDEA